MPQFSTTSWAKSWLLIDVDSTGLFEIQRHDEAGILPDDAAAVRRARLEARKGRIWASYALACHQRDKRQVHVYRREKGYC
jgi:hypothetical protein